MNNPHQQQARINDLKNASIALSVGGSVTSAIGNYYAVLGQRDQLKAQALSMDFEAQVAEFNANLIEQQVARARDSAKNQIGISNMRYGEERAAARANAAARGVKVQSGSAGERERATELMKQIDAMTIQANSEERIASLEQGKANQESAAIIGRESSRNIRSTARSISPAVTYLTTEIGNAGRVANMFYDRFGGRR